MICDKFFDDVQPSMLTGIMQGGEQVVAHSNRNGGTTVRDKLERKLKISLLKGREK